MYIRQGQHGLRAHRGRAANPPLQNQGRVYPPPYPSPQPTEVGLAKHYMEDDRFEEVQELCAKAQGIQAQAVGDNHPLIATTLMLWGQACRAVGKLDEVGWRKGLCGGCCIHYVGPSSHHAAPIRQALTKFMRVLDIRLGIYKTISNQVDSAFSPIHKNDSHSLTKIHSHATTPRRRSCA